MGTAKQTFSSKSEPHEVNWSDSILARIKRIWPKFSVDLSAPEYGPAIEEAEQKFGRYLVEKAIDALRQKYKDVPSIADLIETIHEIKAEQTSNKYGDAKCLYDSNCRDCDEGWMEVWFDDLLKHEQQKLVELYGLEVARTHTKRKRCHCWRGQR